MKTKFTKSSLVIKRQLRTRSKLLKLRPRLSVFRSNKAVYAQIIDDLKGHTLVSAKGKTGKEVGLNLAEKAKLKKVKLIIFDKGGYRYHGKVKAVAEGAREGGLEF
ncbi:50S ribosomal protein L18 [Candidatus Woesebacteria bacterium GWC2_33_12]|uniref:Large ribosomal subunit protein uL18 n=1 Tax=Candidatus Woesebacteria bacterium GW2011_GWB1_33_22 TaxID=1618566 RepID=A0A0F9ZL06_9BACT|nr:MAG: 50S ribosomal protein L18 [Candidatus Woesebacteria bacterium GW2011_GWC2_33_12]KKP42174.1 MAG: 50S ribosomal protein L18 [Candidatus Woesebacteria bacterium GW2011_GWA2_33_20]KKP44908.1 MAG: 50S ribosomal protein L18 [Candidatus Woesebacteria bacterium GW2011_GWB1_33_22]KKP46722.1 MAG: 50S ribosomal protein L18 [Microgenomates group bacterium GW2011_GWC1_33_28]KKP50622.1 MAG: 50S ribosomal protein L18 [Candidatus Woesebacteria bacterium GW2011_GWA1_33_33]OGM07766.1 MAG: 50S ribosomal 